jgi:hypothetical protein
MGKLEEKPRSFQEKSKVKSRALRIMLAVSASLILSFVIAPLLPCAFGQNDEHNYEWVGGTGDWSVPENWEHWVWDPELERLVPTPGVPQADDSATINNGGTVIITGSAQVRQIGLWSGSRMIQTGGNVTISEYFSNDGTYELHQGSFNAKFVHVDGSFVQTGGNVTINEILNLFGTYELQLGSFNANRVHVDGIFVQTGGNVTIEWFLEFVNQGTYELQLGSLSVNQVDIWDDGAFVQSGGNVTISERLQGGTYELHQGSLYVNEVSGGTFIQTGGNVTISEGFSLCTGTYELHQGIFNAKAVGISGGTTFVQTGGNVTISGYFSNDGTYELHQGSFNAKDAFIYGTFAQTGGNATVQGSISLLGFGPVSEYELLGGTLSVGGGIAVGGMSIGGGLFVSMGIGVFVNDEGIVNGTTESTVIWVFDSGGSLTGPGTFNIKVVYESDEIYGTYGNEGVAIDFLPNCLMEGGAFNVTQITPSDFADGNVPNLLPSSVFDVDFAGTYCGEFIIRIPYVVDEASEANLAVLHQTGPKTYERLETVDAAYDIVTAKAHTFGKFAVQSIRDIRVMAWTGGDGTDGHFISEWEDWEEATSAILTIHTQVLDDGQPVEGAEIFFQGISRGQTDNNGHLRFLFSITAIDPITTGPFIGTVEARWDGVLVESEPTLLYESENLVSKKSKPLTPGEAFMYNLVSLLKLYSDRPYIPAGPAWDLYNIIVTIIEHYLEYDARSGDVVAVETYKYTAPNVTPVWLVRDTVMRDGQVVVARNRWTENELKFLEATSPIPPFVYLKSNAILINIASPATLYITAPDGSHAGYEPSTGQLVFDFPIAISEPGDEPFCLLIPYPEKGVYLIHVIPEPNALPTDTYSLEVIINGQTMVLAQDVQIQNIPSEPYIIESKLNPADFDNDGDVDFYDYAAFASRWMSADCHYPDWCEGRDLNYSGLVDFVDLDIFTGNWLWENIPADIDIDGDVDFVDYAVFANHWMNQNCAEPDWCSGADLDKSGSVNLYDLGKFAEYWLEGTSP